MFKGERNSKTDEHNRLNRLVSEAIIRGDLMTKSSLRLDGKIEGNVECVGKLVLGEKGEIIGNCKLQEGEVYGKMVGDMEVSDLIVFHKTAHIIGNINTKRIIIEDGAKIEGMISTNGNAPKSEHNNNKSDKNNNKKSNKIVETVY